MMPVLKSKHRKPVAVQAAIEYPPVIEPVKPSTLPRVYVPKSVLKLWQEFTPPPMVWNRIKTHKSILNCLEPTKEPEPLPVVTRLEDWNKQSILKPDESQLERLGTF